MAQILVFGPSQPALTGFCRKLTKDRCDGCTVLSFFYLPKQRIEISALHRALSAGSSGIEIYILLPASGQSFLWLDPCENPGTSDLQRCLRQRLGDAEEGIIRMMRYVVYPTTDASVSVSALRNVFGKAEFEVWHGFNPDEPALPNSEVVNLVGAQPAGADLHPQTQVAGPQHYSSERWLHRFGFIIITILMGCHVWMTVALQHQVSIGFYKLTTEAVQGRGLLHAEQQELIGDLETKLTAALSEQATAAVGLKSVLLELLQDSAEQRKMINDLKTMLSSGLEEQTIAAVGLKSLFLQLSQNSASRHTEQQRMISDLETKRSTSLKEQATEAAQVHAAQHSKQLELIGDLGTAMQNQATATADLELSVERLSQAFDIQRMEQRKMQSDLETKLSHRLQEGATALDQARTSVDRLSQDLNTLKADQGKMLSKLEAAGKVHHLLMEAKVERQQMLHYMETWVLEVKDVISSLGVDISTRTDSIKDEMQKLESAGVRPHECHTSCVGHLGQKLCIGHDALIGCLESSEKQLLQISNLSAACHSHWQQRSDELAATHAEHQMQRQQELSLASRGWQKDESDVARNQTEVQEKGEQVKLVQASNCADDAPLATAEQHEPLKAFVPPPRYRRRETTTTATAMDKTGMQWNQGASLEQQYQMVRPHVVIDNTLFMPQQDAIVHPEDYVHQAQQEHDELQQ